MGSGDHTIVVDDVDVADGAQASARSDGNEKADVGTDPAVGPPSRQRVWSMPKSPVTRERSDAWGRVARKAGASVAGFMADVARFGGRVARQLGVAIADVPPAVRLLFVAGVAMLLGVVGSIAVDGWLGLLCAIVVVPVCSIALGALGYRWYSVLGEERPRHTETPAAQIAGPAHQRSLEYVDKKLALALSSFGTERHQQAVIALFQAKTAVELTLGTERDDAGDTDGWLPVDDHHLRPRIRAGSESKSSLRGSNSLAAS